MSNFTAHFGKYEDYRILSFNVAVGLWTAVLFAFPIFWSAIRKFPQNFSFYALVMQKQIATMLYNFFYVLIFLCDHFVSNQVIRKKFLWIFPYLRLVSYFQKVALCEFLIFPAVFQNNKPLAILTGATVWGFPYILFTFLEISYPCQYSFVPFGWFTGYSSSSERCNGRFHVVACFLVLMMITVWIAHSYAKVLPLGFHRCCGFTSSSFMSPTNTERMMKKQILIGSIVFSIEIFVYLPSSYTMMTSAWDLSEHPIFFSQVLPILWMFIEELILFGTSLEVSIVTPAVNYGNGPVGRLEINESVL